MGCIHSQKPIIDIKTYKKQQEENIDAFNEKNSDNAVNAKVVDLLSMWSEPNGINKSNGGLFHMTYLVSRCAPYKSIFENIEQYDENEKDTGYEIVKLFQQLMGYIVGADGLSDIEKNLLCKNQYIWSNYRYKNKFVLESMEQGMHFNDNELHEAVEKYVKCLGVNRSMALNSNLYVSLCVAGGDGLSKSEIERYYIVADKFGLNKQQSDKILNTYYAECDLMKLFDESIYGQK